MRHSYAHEAVLDMDPNADIRAPGAAITVELCGHWDHQPPCRLAPHHTAAVRSGRDVRLRILFAAETEQEAQVRLGIERALWAGTLVGPDDVTTRWSVQQSGVSEVRTEDRDHAHRLATDHV